MAKKKNDPIVLRTIILSNNDKHYRCRLLDLGDRARKMTVELQTAKDVENKTSEMRSIIKRELTIYPNFDNLSKTEVAKRKKLVNEYLEKNSLAESLEEVGKEVVKANPKNKNSKDQIISWQPKIEKDLGFEIRTAYQDKNSVEEIELINYSQEYSFKEIHSVELLYKIRPKDFIIHVNNHILNIK